jgi:hypothetical protein
MSGRPKHHEQSVVRDHKTPTRSPKKGTTRFKPKAKPVKDFSMRFPYDHACANWGSIQVLVFRGKNNDYVSRSISSARS